MNLPGQLQRGNFSDQVLAVEDLLKTSPFVQTVIHSKYKVPSVILYTDDQIEDIRQFFQHLAAKLDNAPSHPTATKNGLCAKPWGWHFQTVAD